MKFKKISPKERDKLLEKNKFDMALVRILKVKDTLYWIEEDEQAIHD